MVRKVIIGSIISLMIVGNLSSGAINNNQYYKDVDSRYR